jgi:putative endonuclease
LILLIIFINFHSKFLVLTAFFNAEVAELVDALDSKSSLAHTRCRFESGLRYKARLIFSELFFFMYTIYVIRSRTKKFTYVGFTKNLARRLFDHNSGFNKSTKPYLPFDLIYTETADSSESAREREIFLKSGKGREFLKTIA